MRIGIFVFEGSEELDWAGPYEVLSHWSNIYPHDGVEVLAIGDRDGTITCAKGLKVIPDVGWSDSGELDVLIYPGGEGNRAHPGNDALGLHGPSFVSGQRHQDRGGQAIRRRWRRHHITRRFRGDRHGPAPRRSAAVSRACEGGSQGNPVRSRSTRLVDRPQRWLTLGLS